MINKQIVFNNILNNISINQDIDLREVYDSTMKYNNSEDLELSKRTMYRYLVNAIRHNYTNYDDNLKRVYRLDKNNCVYYKIYKNNILDLIADKYPELSDECDRQKTTLKMIK